MTETDRLRAALRLCAVALMQRLIDRDCPHGDDVCLAVYGQTCDKCAADEMAAVLALQSVAPDALTVEEDQEPPTWQHARARALALVRAAGLETLT